jgi:hypothetical protein
MYLSSCPKPWILTLDSRVGGFSRMKDGKPSVLCAGRKQRMSGYLKEPQSRSLLYFPKVCISVEKYKKSKAQ